MIKLFIGGKGSGKTKTLIELTNNAAQTSKGSVVCIEKGDAEQSVKEYLEYFATNKATSKGTKDIERQRQWYLSDNETRKRYMTWQQELDDLVYDERQRTKAAEKRASEAEIRADEAESRADKYEKILKEHGLL
jgi:ABC-type branched-subunit amino acid transport system ATPase component